MLNGWIAKCLEQHGGCTKAISGVIITESTAPALPTRVLDVSPDENSEQVRLMVSNGASGHYVALSHSWGSPDKRPLTTTKATFLTRLEGISWNSLPKTFQDAIEVTRAVGLRYIWIDSLCIIQDDHEDWLHEAADMGLVYERARLTIAASHAHNSTEGCFLDRPYPPPPVELEYIRDEKHLGSMFVQKSADRADYSPDLGPLSKRAWITQEWTLSRRVIFYTKGRLVWMCKSFVGDETGRKARIGAKQSSWEDIVYYYSARELTYQTDRLIALQGLANETQKARLSDQYLFGLWTGDMPRHLLWRGRDRLTRSPESLQIPSWSWASKIGPVTCSSCMPFIDDFDKGTLRCCAGIAFENSGTLRVEAKMKIVPQLVLTVPIRGQSLSHIDFYKKEGGDFVPMTDMKPEWIHTVLARHVWTTEVGSNYLILDIDGKVLGWATVDEGGWHKLEGDWAQIGVGEKREESIFAVSLVADWKDKGSRRDWYREHFILVKSFGEISGRYLRVGVGIIYSLQGESWFGDKQFQCVTID
jgi:Heterokaryon incompatibility protein (HET)